jgi:ferric-dicitrate binding protein FerR (iron transport regulator)
MKTKTTLSQWIDGKSDFPEDIEGKEIFEKIKTYSEQLEAPAFDKQGVFEKITKAKAEKNQNSATSFGLVLKIAAVVLLLLGVTAIIHQMSWQTSQTGLAQSLTLSLPDNSKVLVQPGSELSVNTFSWFLTREVKLNGEAFFEVEKGETFTVNTNAGQVEVLGTKFNVKATGNKLNVVCYEGRVEVSQPKTKEIITANEFVVMKDDKVLNKSQIVLNSLPTETEFFQIVDESFESLIQDAERYYNVSISNDNITRDKHFTGKLPKENVHKALEIISKTFQLKVKSLNENNFIFVDDANQ